MSLVIDRATFLSGDLKGRNQPVRLPWSLPEIEFRSACNSCGKCLQNCPTQIIEFGRGQMPQINFDSGECLFCGDCLRACDTNALVESKTPWEIKANIDATNCLAFKGVECRSCQDPCEKQAIDWLSLVGLASRPVIDASLCNGCGACYAVCPVKAIQMTTLVVEENT